MKHSTQTVGRYAGTTHTITADTSAARTSSGVGGQTRLVSIVNVSGQTVFVTYGGSAVDATTSDEPVQDGERIDRIVTPGQYVSAITASGSGSVYVVELTS
jgi:hypothetical protein